MSDIKKPLVIKFADNPNVQFYEKPNIEYPQQDFTPLTNSVGPSMDDDPSELTFTVYWIYPWWVRGWVAAWTWLTGGHGNN